MGGDATCTKKPISSPRKAATLSSLPLIRFVLLQSPNTTMLMPTEAMIMEWVREAPFCPHLNLSIASKLFQQENICKESLHIRPLLNQEVWKIVDFVHYTRHSSVLVLDRHPSCTRMLHTVHTYSRIWVDSGLLEDREVLSLRNHLSSCGQAKEGFTYQLHSSTLKISTMCSQILRVQGTCFLIRKIMPMAER